MTERDRTRWPDPADSADEWDDSRDALPLDGRTPFVATWLEWPAWENGPTRAPIPRSGIVTAEPSGDDSYSITTAQGKCTKRRRRNVQLTPVASANAGAIAAAEAEDAMRAAAARGDPQGIDKIIEIVDTAVSYIPSEAWEHAIREGHVVAGGSDDDAWIGNRGVKLEIVPYGLKVWVNKRSIVEWAFSLGAFHQPVPGKPDTRRIPAWLKRLVSILRQPILDPDDED